MSNFGNHIQDVKHENEYRPVCLLIFTCLLHGIQVPGVQMMRPQGFGGARFSKKSPEGPGTPFVWLNEEESPQKLLKLIRYFKQLKSY